MTGGDLEGIMAHVSLGTLSVQAVTTVVVPVSVSYAANHTI